MMRGYNNLCTIAYYCTTAAALRPLTFSKMKLAQAPMMMSSLSSSCSGGSAFVGFCNRRTTSTPSPSSLLALQPTLSSLILTSTTMLGNKKEFGLSDNIFQEKKRSNIIRCFNTEGNNNEGSSNSIIKNNEHDDNAYWGSPDEEESASITETSPPLPPPPPSATFTMDPNTAEARSITSNLGATPDQHEQLVRLSNLVVEWNAKLNLISRVDCRTEVVFGRHVLPSIALNIVPDLGFGSSPTSFWNDTDTDSNADSNTDSNSNKIPPRRPTRVVDVGTGGGFPGVPLAILNPNVRFLLVDSVGKKLKAVRTMVDELGLRNVKTHHGRVEDLPGLVEDDDDDSNDSGGGFDHRGAYDLCLGRSVAPLPKFCGWTGWLLRKSKKGKGGGRLAYIIGGTIDNEVLSKVEADVTIDGLLGLDGASDKRVLVLGVKDVTKIATDASLADDSIFVVDGTTGRGKKQNVDQKRWKKTKASSLRSKNGENGVRKKERPVKGAWKKKVNDGKEKDRGYSNFKRYNGGD